MGEDAFRSRVEAIAQYVNGPYVNFLDRLGLTVDFVRAEGACVYDRDGRAYIDCVAGYGNLNLGHNHPRIVEAIVNELTSPRPYNLPFLSEAQAHLAEAMARITPGDLECTLFVNSGSEAVDSALKLVRLATGKPHIIATRGAWHGFTFGAMSLSEPSMCRSFQPLLQDVIHVDYGDIQSVEDAIRENTGGIIVEPIQAESGAIVPPAGYLQALVELCAKKQLVLIFDEVKSGIGKSGRVFACEHEGAVPDVILAGKALGGGVAAIGTVTARRSLWGKVGLSFPMSSSSGGGNAPACAAALAALEVLKSERLCEQAETQGNRILEALGAWAEAYPNVVSGLSGRGLLIALHTPNLKCANEIVKGCLQRGVLMMAAFCNRTRILIEPPLNILPGQVDTVLEALHGTIKELSAAV